MERGPARKALDGVQKAIRSFVPREENFFVLFERASENAAKGAHVLVGLLGGELAPAEAVKQIEALEHEGDNITHEAVRRLNATFMTPAMFEREDILRVTEALDEIVDMTHGAVERYALYDLTEATEPAKQLAAVLVESTEELHSIMQELDQISPESNEYCAKVNELENEGDRVLKAGLADLFRGTPDPIHVMKWKEIYEFIEEAIDSCEDTVNEVEAAVVKNA
ncbi:MAG: DUF47 family protein [Armatimonadota bacterium]|jgi:predicted phosphate transport protein (TIGR00153 family)